MKILNELFYTSSHEWVQFVTDDTIRLGLTDYAQNAMSDLVFVNLPQVGDKAVEGETLCDVESVKAVSDVYSPVTGEVSAVNEELLDAPGKINSDPYGSFLVEIKGVDARPELLDASAYEALCAKEGN